ncbi:MAG: DUF4238 domain-containing protein [Acidimicrobiia bacterium]
MNDKRQRSKKHHWVPQLYLSRFANERQQLLTVDLATGKRFRQSIRDAAAANNYNEIVEEDGSKSDWAEGYFAQLEGNTARSITEILDKGVFPPRGEDRLWLAFHVAFQHLRSPVARRFHDELAEHTFKLEIAAGGPNRLRDVLEAEGFTASDDDVAEHWDAISAFDWSLAMPTSEHIRLALELGSEVAPAIASMHWNLVHFERKRLLTSDHPVGLMSTADKPSWMGMGFFNATLISLPLDRRTALLIRPLLPIERSVPENAAIPPTAKFARILNQLTVNSADRWVYHHPEDDPTAYLDLRYAPGSLRASGLTLSKLASMHETGA